MYSETITLFNRYHSRLGDMWYPHILKNVNLIVDKASVLEKYGAESTDRASLHIKYQNTEDGIVINGVPYLPSKEWSALTTDEMAECITFNTDAVYFDFFVIGEYDSEPIFDDKFADSSLFERLSKDYECYVLTSASSPYKVIPHFEIMAR